MNDEKLIELAQEVDTMLPTLAMKYDLDPLQLSGIILARMAHFNGVFNRTDEYRQLCKYAHDFPLEPNTAAPNIH